MPNVPPDGDAMPADGGLAAAGLDGLGKTAFGMYVHVPFCLTRCGYCDFNTYTAPELASTELAGTELAGTELAGTELAGTELAGAVASRDNYAGLAIEEIRLAGRVLAGQAPAVSTVFFGGGTPTLLAPRDLAAILSAIDGEFGLAADAEVTTEANPDSVDQRALGELRAAGFTRMSFGMQSSVSHVLAILDRSHTPGRAQQCVAWARAEGFEHVSLDLIYGAPGESAQDWEHSLGSAIDAGPDHISAYALIVEDGTRLAARIRRGELAPPDDDELADRYLAAEAAFSAAGLSWYEVSNWAAGPEAACRHNLLYWTDGNWWGVGPGAHSHVNGTRWWNVRHPSAYADRLRACVSPGQAREILSDAERRTERIMLTTRLATGCDVAELSAAGLRAARTAVTEGLADPAALKAGRVVLTTRGRLLADAVIRDLVD